jgi:predicted signal transduction protein with EAL and GGDEF domain
VAERIREGFAKAALEVDGRPVEATVSIGLVFCQEAALEMTELLAQADHALYFAKENGRNRVEIASLEMMLARQHVEPVVGATSLSAIAAKSAA